MNRAIRSRILVRQNLVGKKTKPSVQKESVKIVAKDPVTGEVKESFDSIEDAVAKGFYKPNINGAIKNQTKYKGYLWTNESI